MQEELQAAIVSLPNFPADIVPEGKTAEDNLVVKLVESYTQLPENPLPHWELARKYDIIDFDLGVKLTPAGATWPYGKDPRDTNIRIAPSYPTVEDLEAALDVLVLAVKLVAAELARAERA